MYRELGRDANGSSLVAEQRELLDEEGIDDAGERAAYRELFGAFDREYGAVRQHRLRQKRGEAD